MQRIVFYSFLVGDVEDPEIYAAVPLGAFMATEKGLWIKENCPDPVYVIRNDPSTYGVRVFVYGDVEDKFATEYYLKWNKEEY